MLEFVGALLEPLDSSRAAVGAVPIPPVQHKALGTKPQVPVGNFLMHHPSRAGCWTSRSSSPGHCSVPEMGWWWCAANLPAFGVAIFIQIIPCDRGAAFKEFCQLSYGLHIGQNEFWAGLSSSFYPKISQWCVHISQVWNPCLGSLRASGMGVGIPAEGLWSSPWQWQLSCLLGSLGMLLGEFNLLNFEPTSSFSVQSVP